MQYRLPDFTPVQTEEMRAIWRRRRISVEELERVLLEIERSRRVLAQIERLRISIERSWQAEAGGQLAGLYILRRLLQGERERIGIVQAKK